MAESCETWRESLCMETKLTICTAGKVMGLMPSGPVNQGFWDSTMLYAGRNCCNTPSSYCFKVVTDVSYKRHGCTWVISVLAAYIKRPKSMQCFQLTFELVLHTTLWYDTASPNSSLNDSMAQVSTAIFPGEI